MLLEFPWGESGGDQARPRNPAVRPQPPPGAVPSPAAAAPARRPEALSLRVRLPRLPLPGPTPRRKSGFHRTFQVRGCGAHGPNLL